ncbi:hypothetical protein KSP40_PGU005229 [Platanthera guangdongensis]|uniref:Uncharacterized protein n=1 Tax=Platanthera guangdongensis TaxID=2320717 RepID=A0ABR2ME48_9ASPA
MALDLSEENKASYGITGKNKKRVVDLPEEIAEEGPSICTKAVDLPEREEETGGDAQEGQGRREAGTGGRNWGCGGAVDLDQGRWEARLGRKIGDAEEGPSICTRAVEKHDRGEKLNGRRWVSAIGKKKQCRSAS